MTQMGSLLALKAYWPVSLEPRLNKIRDLRGEEIVESILGYCIEHFSEPYPRTQIAY
jgi:hypothetical protein